MCFVDPDIGGSRLYPSHALSQRIASAGLDTEISNLVEDVGVVSNTDNKLFILSNWYPSWCKTMCRYTSDTLSPLTLWN